MHDQSFFLKEGESKRGSNSIQFEIEKDGKMTRKRASLRLSARKKRRKNKGRGGEKSSE